MSLFPADTPTAHVAPEALRALIESRRAVRRFSAEPVPDEVVRDCLELAVLAPNSCNLQPWSFQVIRDPALLARLHPVCMSQNAAKAPLIIAVLARPDTWKQACQNIIDYWPEPDVPARIRHFYSKTAPFQYNQGPFGLFGLFKRQLLRVAAWRKALASSMVACRRRSTPSSMAWTSAGVSG